MYSKSTPPAESFVVDPCDVDSTPATWFVTHFGANSAFLFIFARLSSQQSHKALTHLHPEQNRTEQTNQMTANAPASSALLAQKLGDHTIAPAGYTPSPAWMETFCGVQGSTRRKVSWFLAALSLSTGVRMACFSPLIFGNYLLKTLGPIERPSVDYSPILGVRSVDLILGAYAWQYVEGQLRRDGILFGLLLTSLSRLSLYTFESAYFLLSPQTASTLFLIDLFALSSGFSLLPTFLPHSIPSRPPTALKDRLTAHKELIINLVLAVGLATFTGAFCGYTWERVGGMEFVKQSVFELRLPSWLARDTLTAPEMMANPTLPVPTMRSFLKPQSMLTHLSHSFLPSLFSIPLVTILPRLTPFAFSLLTFSLVLPSSLLLWDIMPITLSGALTTGFSIAARDAIMVGVVAWVLEELRVNVVRVKELVIVEEEEDGTVEVTDVVVEETEEVGAVVEDVE